MPLIETTGSGSAKALGLNSASSAVNYIEDVFSTYLYAGNSSTQTITNGIDLSTYGGLVWGKSRNNSSGNNNHYLEDTARGPSQFLFSNLDNAQNYSPTEGISSFNTNGFSLLGGGRMNASGDNMVSWTFRKQAKFFDVVTYTGTGSAQNIAHSLGSVPGAILIKRTDSTAHWGVYHRSLQTTPGLENKGIVYLNLTNSVAYGTSPWNNTAPTSTQFTVGSAAETNASGATYVAYLFAHDAGGFGTSGTDNVISCGSFTTSGTAPNNATVNLGYEPQFLLYKISDTTGDWRIVDNMRGFLAAGGSPTSPQLRPNLSNAEQNTDFVQLTSTGFTTDTGIDAQTYIYIAIRRGPMKTPTSGTSVFSPAYGAYTTGTVVTTGFPVDLQFGSVTGGSSLNALTSDRLRGVSTTSTASSRYLVTSSTAAEATTFSTTQFWDNTGFQTASAFDAPPSVFWNFRRAPSFMDVVCWYGDPATVNHNLTVVPELIIQKNRTTTQGWGAWRPGINYGFLNTTAAFTTYTSGTVTSTTFTPLATGSGTSNYVAYLFASCSGVSKVGSYTGTGTTKQIDCGFTGGARFVLIKRTDSTGDWYVWDSARGIVAGNDPYLLLNSTAAEVTNTDYVDTYSAGFEISSTAPAAINANGGTFIFLAIA